MAGPELVEDGSWRLLLGGNGWELFLIISEDSVCQSEMISIDHCFLIPTGQKPSATRPKSSDSPFQKFPPVMSLPPPFPYTISFNQASQFPSISFPFHYHPSNVFYNAILPSIRPTSKSLRRILILPQNPLPNQLFRLRPPLQLMFQTIGSHVLLQLSLLSLEGGCGGGVGEDVACVCKVGGLA